MKTITLTVCISASVPDDANLDDIHLDMQPSDFVLGGVCGGEVTEFCTQSVTTKWRVEDWAGNRLFPDKEFDSFEDGWDFVCQQIADESERESILVVQKVS